MAGDILTSKELGIPSLPSGSPAHLEHIIDELNESLDLDAPGTSLRVLKKAFLFLSCYYADLIEAVASVFGELKFNFRQAGDIAEATETIQKGLDFLKSGAPQELPEVKTLLNTFYEGLESKKFARILEIGGKPRRGTMPLTKLIASPIPPRDKCVKEVRNYTPYLKEWLEAASYLFSNTTILSERTSLNGCQTIKVQIGNQVVELGKRLEISDCPLCIPGKEINIPPSLYDRPIFLIVPQKTPKFLSQILDRLDSAMKNENAVAGCLELRNALEFLIRYFAGVSSKILEELGALPASAEQYIDANQSISSSEKLLNLCLNTLKTMLDSSAAKAIINIFYKRNELFEFIPRWHTEILALNGQLSAWCQLEPGYGELEDAAICKLQFEKHVSTLREWLIALGGYLRSTEHFFNEPEKDGSVEFSLRIGDRFIEVGEPGYVLWLNNPRPQDEIIAPESESDVSLANKPLIRESLEIPSGCPLVLKRILTRMDIYLRLGNPIESCTSLRDALDYLTRYYAGVAAAAFRKLGTLPPEAEALAQQSLSIHDCEKLLILALRSIGHDSDEKLGLAVRSVFYYTDEYSNSYKPTGAHSRILALDADPLSKMQNLAEFCSLKTGEGVLSHPARSKRELERFLPTLQDWLATSEAFFKEAKHHEEPPEADGKTELVIEYQGIYLELVEPDYIFYIRPGADDVPDIEAPELPPLELAIDEDFVDAPVRKKSAEEIALERPFITHRVDLIGERPNSKGKKCAAGYIVLTNAGGGTLSGTAIATNPAIEVEPARFRGNKVSLSYWIDTAAVPKDFEIFILLKTAHDERSISVYEMIGQAKTKPVSKPMGILALLTPSLAFITSLVLIFQGISKHMESKLRELVGANWGSYRLIADAPEAHGAVVLYSQLIGYFYLFTAGIIPVLAARRFRSMPPATQELLHKYRVGLMLLPIPVMLLAVYTPLLSNSLSQGNNFSAMNLRHLILSFIGINLASTYYQDMSISQKLDDIFINTEVRKILPIVGWFMFFTAILLGVSY